MLRHTWPRRLPASMLVALLATWTAAGCGPRVTPVYPTRGSLRLNGKAVPGVTLVFHLLEGAANDTRPFAVTEPDGKFTVTTRAAGDGAPAGTYAVTLIYEPLVSPGLGKRTPAPEIPAKFLKPDTTPLRATVAAAPKNELSEFTVP